MDSELLLKFFGISQTTFQRCRVRFYAFFGSTFDETAVCNEDNDFDSLHSLFSGINKNQ